MSITSLETTNRAEQLAPVVLEFKERAMGAIQTLYKGREQQLLLAAHQLCTNELKGCTDESKLIALLKAVDTGLNFNPLFSEVFFVPYNGVCTFQAGYKGLIKLAKEVGIEIYKADLVYKHEAKDFLWQETEEGIKMHRPRIFDDRKRSTDVLCAYVLAKVNGKTEGILVEYVRLEQKRMLSKAPDSGAWVKGRHGMYIKAAITDFLRPLPMSPKLGAAVFHDFEEESVREVEVKLTPPTPPRLEVITAAPDATVSFGRLYEAILDKTIGEKEADDFVAWCEADPDRPVEALEVYLKFGDRPDVFIAFYAWSLLRKLPQDAFRLFDFVADRYPVGWDAFIQHIETADIAPVDWTKMLNIKLGKK